MTGLSSALNSSKSTMMKMEDSQFLIIARHLRTVWKEWGSPLPNRSSVNVDADWKVTTFHF